MSGGGDAFYTNHDLLVVVYCCGRCGNNQFLVYFLYVDLIDVVLLLFRTENTARSDPVVFCGI